MHPRNDRLGDTHNAMTCGFERGRRGHIVKCHDIAQTIFCMCDCVINWKPLGPCFEHPTSVCAVMVVFHEHIFSGRPNLFMAMDGDEANWFCGRIAWLHIKRMGITKTKIKFKKKIRWNLLNLNTVPTI